MKKLTSHVMNNSRSSQRKRGRAFVNELKWLDDIQGANSLGNLGKEGKADAVTRTHVLVQAEKQTVRKSVCKVEKSRSRSDRVKPLLASKVIQGAVAGTSMEAGIDTGDLQPSPLAKATVKAVQLAVEAITGEMLADKIVTSEKLADGAVTTVHLSTAAVKAAQLAPDAVEAAHLSAGSVKSGQLAEGVVGSRHLAIGAVSGRALSWGAVTNRHIAAGAIGSEQLGNDTIDGLHIKQESISGYHLLPGSITSNHLETGLVEKLLTVASSVAATGVQPIAALMTEAAHVKQSSTSVARTYPSTPSGKAAAPVPQFGLSPFLLQEEEETVLIRVQFAEPFADERYALVVTTNQINCYGVIRQKYSDSAIIQIVRSKQTPHLAGIANWIAIGEAL